MTLTAVLLAGGESGRMGREKATIVFQGEALWQRQLRLLEQLKPERIFLSARRELPWRPREIDLLLDEPPSRGPVSGLTRALQQMRTSHLIALAVDMPFMTAANLEFLWKRVSPGCGILPIVGEHAEPLAAFYPKEARDDFIAALAGTDFSLQGLTRLLVLAGRLRSLEIPSEQRNLYRSVNEPRDLA